MTVAWGQGLWCRMEVGEKLIIPSKGRHALGRWSRVQLKPGLKSEFSPCVTPGNLLNLSEPLLYHWHKEDKNANLIRLLWELNGRKNVRCLARCLGNSKCFINASNCNGGLRQILTGEGKIGALVIRAFAQTCVTKKIFSKEYWPDAFLFSQLRENSSAERFCDSQDRRSLGWPGWQGGESGAGVESLGSEGEWGSRRTPWTGALVQGRSLGAYGCRWSRKCRLAS